MPNSYNVITETLDIQLDPKASALLVIDMQNDFVSPGGYHDRKGDGCGIIQEIIPHIQFLLDKLPREVKCIYIVRCKSKNQTKNRYCGK